MVQNKKTPLDKKWDMEKPVSVHAPKRFVGLHSHSGFSTYDGMGLPQEHIDFVLENGMNSWGLTDHGHMNSFAHAYLHAQKKKKEGIDFKFIPGCEMYLHPDLDAWKLDYNIKKAAKSGDKSALAKLRAQRESLVSPLEVIQDEDGDIIEIDKESVGLTIENEDESKAAKFYDPIKRRHHLVVLPKTSLGLQRLFHLVSKGYKDGFYRFPRVDYKMLKEAADGDNLMISTACISGPLGFEVFRYFQQVEFDKLHADLLDDEAIMKNVQLGIGNAYGNMVDAVGLGNVKLELQFNKLPAQHLVNRAIMKFADDNGLSDSLIVTADSHYPNPDQWKEREIYKKLGWLNYKQMNPDEIPQSKDELKCELYPKNANQVWETYKETGTEHSFYNDTLVFDAIERTYDIAHDEIGDINPDCSMKLPSYVVPKDTTEDRALLDFCKEGLVKRGLEEKAEYIERIRTELKVIRGKGFSKYFLTMKAIMDIANEHMLTGCGRGSAAGSLVAYVLYITNVDPIEYGLLFSRFLSEHREGCPDIDSDFADRDRLIGLLKEEFGDYNVIPISNYNTFKLKSLVKDISRFYGIEFDIVNKALAPVESDVRKEIYKKGTDKNLFVLCYEDAIAYSKTFRAFIEEYPQVAEPIKVLFKQNKSLGRHAGGVIVSENIEQRMPLILARGEAQTPWVEGMNYKHLEDFGWIKFDLLGLETLRIIERAISLILQRREGVNDPEFADVKEWFVENMDTKNINFNDQAVYENVYHSGRWGGIFQCTARGAQAFFKKGKPESIVDLATLTSIYRPGPLDAGVHKIYMEARANPDAVEYGHPLIKQVLEKTVNCIVFQEQVMELCNVVAGFPLSECDKVRRVIMKRSASKAEAMKKQSQDLKDRFVEGAVNNGVDKQLAAALYDKILFFSGYGFNKSHAVSYSINSYYCAWLMTHYEEEWLCAYLEAMSGNPKKRAKALSEIKKLGYNVIPVDVNHAKKSWTILPGKKFMPSFLSLKGIGESAIEEIITNRPYSNITEMLWNEDGTWRHSKFNKRAMSSLIKVKAFESMKLVGEDKQFSSYAQLHEIVISNNSEIKKRTKKDPDRGKNNFDRLTLETYDMPDWSRLEVAENSTDILGSFSAGTLVSDELQEKLAEKGINSIDDYEESDLYWFVVTDTIEKLTKNKKKYLLLTVTGPGGATNRMFCWGWNGKIEISKFALCVAEVSKSDFGFATTQWKVKVLN